MYSVPLSYLVTILQIKLCFWKEVLQAFVLVFHLPSLMLSGKKKTITNASYTCSLQGKNTS